MGEEDEVIGYYKDGRPIHKHPSSHEIEEHLSEYFELAKAHASREQWEALDEMRNWYINTQFMRRSKMLTPEQAIDLAIKYWVDQYPWEVKPFLSYIKTLRTGLNNYKGFSTDKDKSLLFQGSMPDKIKTMLIAHDPEFFKRDKAGHSKNLNLFYSRFRDAKVGGA